MTIKEFTKKQHNNIFYTFVAAMLLCVIFLVMTSNIYLKEEADCYEYLHLQTKQFKDDIKNQIDSDKETLSLVANLASQIYEKNQDLKLVFDSYEPTGLISNVGILLPDNTFVTKNGTLNFEGSISFDEEITKGEYISGRVKDVTNSKLEIIRLAQPIISNGKAIGIVYGSINLDTLSKRYTDNVSELNAQLYVYESGTGNLIIDTFDEELGNISTLKGRKYDKGYSYEQLINSEKGYSVFQSKTWDEKMYIHFSPLGISDWKIMLARRQTHVFEQANNVVATMNISFALILLILIMYFMLLLKKERIQKHTTTEASQIRKLLLEVNQQQGNISDALEKITVFSNARSSFFVNTNEEDYNYISSAFAERHLLGEDRKYFVSEILGYAAQVRAESGKMVNIVSLATDSSLEKTNPKLHSFLTENSIGNVVFVAVADKNNQINVLATINPKRTDHAKSLLAEIAVCFSIAIFNKKHLHKTEKAASTDSLTGLLNRVTYKKDIMCFDEEKPENFACVYVDVNELHLCNNKYGHAAGDEMLIYIANTLKEVFYGNNIYRMGGDEFLVFIENTDQDSVKKAIDTMAERLMPKNYHIAIGMSYRTQNTNTEELVNEAEIRMYEAKAQYYQNKENKIVSATEDTEYKITKTGIGEIDTLLDIMKDRYNGIYSVLLNTDEAHRILMPAYLDYNETEKSFKDIFAKYVEDMVDPDFHRAMLSFVNYEAIKRQLAEGKIPRITYKKVNSETVVLSVYSFKQTDKDINHTLWVFEKI